VGAWDLGKKRLENGENHDTWKDGKVEKNLLEKDESSMSLDPIQSNQGPTKAQCGRGRGKPPPKVRAGLDRQEQGIGHISFAGTKCHDGPTNQHRSQTTTISTSNLGPYICPPFTRTTLTRLVPLAKELLNWLIARSLALYCSKCTKNKYHRAHPISRITHTSPPSHGYLNFPGGVPALPRSRLGEGG